MKYTKEPWIASGRSIKQDYTAIGLPPESGQTIAAVMGGNTSGPYFVESNAECEANARRIVACVNACARFATDDLERFPLVSEHGFALYESVKKQRDELLAASQMALRLFDHEGRECREAIVLRRAIDNSTGETK